MIYYSGLGKVTFVTGELKMSLFEYAQEVVSRKLERKEPVLSGMMGGLPMTDKMQTYMNRPVLPNTPAGKMDGSPFMEAAEKRGIPTTNRNMNMMVDLVNRGVPLEEAANLTEQKLMPMAQGGGLSSVQNSLNINGQPHRLAYINPNEEDLLKSLGGSGRKIDGIPAYDDSVDGGSNQGGPDDGIDDSVDGGSNQSAPDTDVGSFGTMGLGGYTDAQAKGTTQGLDAAMAEVDAEAAAKGEAEAYSSPQNQAVAPGLGFYGPYSVPEKTFVVDKGYSVNPDMTYSQNIGLGVPGTASAVTAALGFDPSIATVTGPTTSPGGNQGDDGDDSDTGADTAGDIIIKEKIAAVKEVPVEDVSDVEVTRVKQTAKERIAGTNIEDIIRQMYGVAQANRLLNINRQPTEEEEEINHRADLIDSIYGPGSSAGLLGITTNNTGTA